MGKVVALKAINDNDSQARLKRALEELEKASLVSRQVCAEYRETLRTLRDTVKDLEYSTKEYQKSLGHLHTGIMRTNRLSKGLYDIMDKY